MADATVTLSGVVASATVLFGSVAAAVTISSVATATLTFSPSSQVGSVVPALPPQIATVSAPALNLAASVMPQAPAQAATLTVETFFSVPGPPGPIGPAGGGSSFATIEFTGVGAGQSVTLASPPGDLKILVINGLVESPVNYSISGANLIVPNGLVWDGAACTFVYQTTGG